MEKEKLNRIVIPNAEDSFQPSSHQKFIMVSEYLLTQIAKKDIWNQFKKDPVNWVKYNAGYFSSEQE